MGTSSPSQGCAGCTHWGALIRFPVMLPTGQTHVCLSPRQKPVEETLLQPLSSTWLPGTPLHHTKTNSTLLSKLSMQLSHLGQVLHAGSHWPTVCVPHTVRPSSTGKRFLVPHFLWQQNGADLEVFQVGCGVPSVCFEVEVKWRSLTFFSLGT